ncbi:uncharacterized protein LOC117220934 [Megalopta genalis]|uniref:uncharacterized protein LOC117220934 n=1 Tax=Megalopta genalis TaxID=115081 RepID=UPI003FD3C924
MSDSGDAVKYKWTPDSTSLLVSVWSDRQVQKQLEYTSKPQLIWDSVARYMKKKGYNVSGKQCRSRMKQVLVCYREAKRAGTRAGVEQYYESIDRVLKNKRLEEVNTNGIDTVDAAIHVKSPPKEVKTNKNLQMRHKFQEPVQSMHHSEALSPTWGFRRENEYPDSPESNETVIARPYNRVFSPTRDVAINTGEQLVQLAGKSVQYNSIPMEEPLRANYKQNLLPYRYGEIPYQNAVQNVQNQIIQENMQQHQTLQQNCMSHQQNMLVNNLGFQQNQHNLNQNLIMQPVDVPMKISPTIVQNVNLEQLLQQQNHLQQVAQANNRAMPQEPRKIVFGQNLAATYKQQYGNMLSHMPAVVDNKGVGCLSPDYSPDVSQNLNDAFCQTKNDDKSHNLNETYNQAVQAGTQDASILTNNATCNDESLILEFLMDSLSQAGSDHKSKDTAVNTDNIPNVPIRKKKAQKLEQLVLGAISSQNEVVNRILAAQNDMLTKFLDLDRDRQNRLENRLDDLLKVVHNNVLTKQSSETDVGVSPPSPEPTITCLVPPPMPGAAPPKLDLVPPKPCRVPCTVPNSNVELINQNPVMTRPGIVSPITSPVKKPGTIWSKLGPVSQSPFVKAQQRLGFQAVSATDTRTQSSAERRIAREMDQINMNTETLKYETTKFLEMERQLEEKVENARLETAIGRTLHARRRLFTQREPNAAMILTAAFLENECRISEQLMDSYERQRNLKNADDELLTGQGESYDHLRRLSMQPACVAGEPCDTSTPAKFGAVSGNSERAAVAVPKQTIQQLAQLVMNTGRWKDLAAQNRVASVQINAERQQSSRPPIQMNAERLQSNRPLVQTNIGQENGFPLVQANVERQNGFPLVQANVERQNGFPVVQANVERQNGFPVVQANVERQNGFPLVQANVERQNGFPVVQANVERQNGFPVVQANVEKLQNGYQANVERQQNCFPAGYNDAITIAQPSAPFRGNDVKPDKSYVKDWVLNKYGDAMNEQKTNYAQSCNTINTKPNFPIGFTNALLDTENAKMKEANVDVRRSIGYNNNTLPDRKQQTVRFMDEALAELQRMYIERLSKDQQEKNDSLPYVAGNGNSVSIHSRQMIEKYINDIMPKRQFRDGKDRDSDSDDEFLDTTTSMPTIVPRRGSLTSTGTASTEAPPHSTKLSKDNCVIS